MIEVQITDKMMEWAEKKAKELSLLNKSIMKGKGNLTGFLGEAVVAKHYQEIYKVKLKNTYDYDLLINDQKVDVKSKLTKKKPLNYYDCSVAAYNTKQQCDYYFFVRILNDYSVGWIVGYYPKDAYYENARFLREGSKDGDNGFIVRADCYNMMIKDLYHTF